MATFVRKVASHTWPSCTWTRASGQGDEGTVQVNGLQRTFNGRKVIAQDAKSRSPEWREYLLEELPFSCSFSHKGSLSLKSSFYRVTLGFNDISFVTVFFL